MSDLFVSLEADALEKGQTLMSGRPAPLGFLYIGRQRSRSLAVLLLVPLFLVPAVLADPHLHARAVSFSLVEGTVMARTPGSPTWARAMVNMPIEQGLSIATARHSSAEVQFENGSTVRLGELSRIDFAQLALDSDGGFVSHLTLAVGFATINVIPKRHDKYVITATGVSLLPHGKTEFRADLSHGHLRVEVFNGRVRAADSKPFGELRKNQVLACDYSTGGTIQVADTIQMDKWDKWVQSRNRQVSQSAYTDPPAGMYSWENDLIPFGGLGLLPGTFAVDGF